MFEAVPQELKDEVEKVLRSASREAYSLLDDVEKLIGTVSEQLEDWADMLHGETVRPEGAGTDTRYLYLLNHPSNNKEDVAMYERLREYLLDPTNEVVLEALYRAKMEQAVLKENYGPAWWNEFLA